MKEKIYFNRHWFCDKEITNVVGFDYNHNNKTKSMYDEAICSLTALRAKIIDGHKNKFESTLDDLLKALNFKTTTYNRNRMKQGLDALQKCGIMQYDMDKGNRIIVYSLENLYVDTQPNCKGFFCFDYDIITKINDWHLLSVFITLMSFFRDGETYVSQETLADHCGIDVRSIRRNIQSLIDKCVIKKQVRARNSNVYTLHTRNYYNMGSNPFN